MSGTQDTYKFPSVVTAFKRSDKKTITTLRDQLQSMDSFQQLRKTDRSYKEAVFIIDLWLRGQYFDVLFPMIMTDTNPYMPTAPANVYEVVMSLLNPSVSHHFHELKIVETDAEIQVTVTNDVPDSKNQFSSEKSVDKSVISEVNKEPENLRDDTGTAVKPTNVNVATSVTQNPPVIVSVIDPTKIDNPDHSKFILADTKHKHVAPFKNTIPHDTIKDVSVNTFDKLNNDDDDNDDDDEEHFLTQDNHDDMPPLM
jgi:hypothetical protein